MTMQTARAGVTDHPAVRAWARLEPTRADAIGVTALKRRSKGKVYRLEGAGPNGSAVIAKRSSRARILQERAIYERVLRELAVSSVRCYGFVDEPDADCAWLFLEDAGGDEYSAANEQHRVLAARWLSALHTSGVHLPAGQLPERGPSHYLEHLRSARDTIARNLTNPALTAADVGVLTAIERQCEIIDSRWSVVERLCVGMPRTLIHGDFAPKNMRVRAGERGLSLVAFDWGSTGWGVAAADLVQWSGTTGWSYWASPDLDAYGTAVRAIWPELDTTRLHLVATVGKLFRCLVCISLSAQSFATPWVERAAGNMIVYHAELADALSALGWTASEAS